MLKTIYDLVQDIVVFTLLFSLVYNLTAGKSYEKYIRFYGGIIFMLLLLKPIGILVSKNFDFEKILEENYQDFEKSQLETELKIADEKTGEAILYKYQENLEAEMEKKLEKENIQADILVELKQGEENYGEIKKILVHSISCKETEEEEKEAGKKEGGEEKKKIYMEPVEIDEIVITEVEVEEEKEKKTEEEAYGSLGKEIRKILQREYGIKKSQIIFT